MFIKKDKRMKNLKELENQLKKLLPTSIITTEHGIHNFDMFAVKLSY